MESTTKASSSDVLKEIKSFTANEGRWSSRVTHTGESGHWKRVKNAGVVLASVHSSPVLKRKWESRVGRAAFIKEGDLQWEHAISVSAASAWALPRQMTHSLCPSASSRGNLLKILLLDMSDSCSGRYLASSAARGSLYSSDQQAELFPFSVSFS